MADFFDKMMDGLNKGVASVSTGSKLMLEKNKLNSYIKTLENEKKQLTEVLGNKIYNIYCEKPESDIANEEFANICKEISKRIRLINEQKRKIEDLDRERNEILGNGTDNQILPCSCGHMNSVNAKFCVKCGNRLV